jgi:glycosyltransferase involved in cell wall biosynthesis
VSARRFFARQLPPPAVARVERAFALATRVAFSAGAGQLPHAALAGRRNFRVLPGWIDVARIQAYAAAHPRLALRQALGLPGDAVVFANIGSILPRKGQHVFLEAIALLRQRAPAAPPLVFLLVGAKTGPDAYTDLLRQAIAAQSLPEVHLVVQAADSYQYFQAADICVCSSLEEMLPRVVMEAAVFGRSIVTTNVNGIPELLQPDEAWLVPPNDANRLAAAMQAALDAQVRGDRSKAERARQAVTTRFDAAVLLPRHADLVRTVAAIPLN